MPATNTFQKAIAARLRRHNALIKRKDNPTPTSMGAKFAAYKALR